MAPRASNGWQDLQAEMLAQLEGDDFESFCEALVRFEALDRQVDPELYGSAGKYVPDGGRDLLLSVKKPPAHSKSKYQAMHHLVPITEDPIAGRSSPTRTVYSYKGPTPKNPKSWLDKALKDVEKGAKRAVEVLAEGGYFKLLINQQETLDAEVKRGGETRTSHQHLRNAFWERLRQVDRNAEDPGDRIQIFEAGEIAAYLRARQPEGGEMDLWLRRLGLTPVLMNLDGWRTIHVTDRQQPQLVEDSVRTQIRDQILEFASPNVPSSTTRVACVVGKPGVGKTRLVLESLTSVPGTAQRARVALSPPEAMEAINNRELLRRHPNLLLVVDDCLVDETRMIASRFSGHAQLSSSARLLLLVPASLDAVGKDLPPSSKRWSLEPLDPEHAREVVGNELERPKDDADVVTIADFSEGFPWFARLLAVEFREAQRPPVDMREAVRWALASLGERSSPDELVKLRLVRARTLLAASLTRSVDWDQLPHDKREQLAKAVGLSSWQVLIDEAHQCVKRGILRRSLGWKFKYVTPQILEREVLSLLLGPDGPDGGGRTLQEFAAEYLGELFETLNRLELADHGLIKSICDVALEDLRRVELGSFAEDRWSPRLQFLAHHRPGETAHVLRRLIEHSSIEDLRAVSGHRAFVWALEELIAHDEAIDDAEEAVFRLSRAENESYANNATAVWSWLFHVELNMTTRPLAERLQLLARRMSESDVRARLVALRGVESAVTAFPVRITSAPRGVRSSPTPAEAREGRLRAWSLLCERFADPEPTVAKAAKQMAVKHLRGALITFHIGQEVMNMIETRVGEFSDEERISLREKIEEMRAYDSKHFDPTDVQPAALEAAVAPRSFGERLRQRVGVWGPASLRGENKRLDDALASEGLQGDTACLREQLEWLVTEQAQRAHAFASAIGRADVEGTLFDDLRQLARTHPDSWKAQALVARYVGGVVEAGRLAQAESLFHAMQRNPDEASATALACIEVGATPERLAWLVEALRAGCLPDLVIQELGRRNEWLESASEDEFLDLIQVMAAGGPIACSAALDLFVDRDQQPRERALSLLDILLSALAPASTHGMTDYHWELGAKMLVDGGMAARAAELAVVALMRERGSNDFAWNVLHYASERDASGAFRAVARGLEVPGPGGRLLIAFWYHRVAFAWPANDVLAWVGDDERRGRAAAGIVRVRSEELPEVLRELIRRFGPRSSVAREIEARMTSTDGMVPSLAEHAGKQLDRARHWIDDPDPSIAAFAKKLVADLENEYEQHAAYEEDERRRFGT